VQNEAVGSAVKELYRLSANDDVRYEYEARQKAIRDEHARMQYGIQQGIQQGLQQGIQQGIQQGLKTASIQFAKNALAKGFTVQDIAGITGLSEDEIKNLK